MDSGDDGAIVTVERFVVGIDDCVVFRKRRFHGSSFRRHDAVGCRDLSHTPFLDLYQPRHAVAEVRGGIEHLEEGRSVVEPNDDRQYSQILGRDLIANTDDEVALVMELEWAQVDEVFREEILA